MDTTLKKDLIRKYEKPITKKHDALNTVQGSLLYSDLPGLYYTYYYYYTYYH